MTPPTRRRIMKNLPAMTENPPPGLQGLVETLEQRFASVGGYPAGGAVAALAAGLAASLTAAAADRSRREWDEAGGARAQAQALARRAAALAERDAAEYVLARTALDERGGEREPASAA